MEFITIGTERFGELKALHTAYKTEIGEEQPGEQDFESLKNAFLTALESTASPVFFALSKGNETEFSVKSAEQRNSSAFSERYFSSAFAA